MTTTFVTDEQIAAETGCVDIMACADDVTLCECGRFVCPRCTPNVIDCTDGLGAHHENCVRDCAECSAADASDHACGEAS